ncbi:MULTISPECIES: hypothetical protein [unclassified Rhizobium]|jgi:hypothetical protein|nr:MULTISPECIES: hypothetical protein [unclassified Rhizobium]EJJ29288.1 hypothetical protein PMI11_02422 [Rhizobium sp. CF142]MDR6666996.1 hypothetical protein [Rhizobium sp. 1399]
MIHKATFVATIFAMYVFTMFFIAAIPQEVVQAAGVQIDEVSVVK